jgi:hypothetical protein
MHKDEFQCMAGAARGYLAISASDGAVERLFNRGRDLLVGQHFLTGETMTNLMLLTGMCNKDADDVV